MARTTEGLFRIVVKQLPNGQVSVQREIAKFEAEGEPIVTDTFDGARMANCIASSERGCLGVVYIGDKECSCPSFRLRTPGQGCPEQGLKAG